MKDLKNIKKCRICKSSDLKIVLELYKTPIGENFNLKKKNNKFFNLDLFQCSSCGLCQLKQVINPKLLYEKYLYQSYTSVGLKNHFENYSKKVSKYLSIKKNDLVVDIGSNDGMLLKSFKNSYYRVLGIEPAKKISIVANKNGINTINSYFNEKTTSKILKNYGNPRLVTANNVLANVDNIKNWIINIKKLIKDEGFFVFESFSLRDVIKNKVIDFIYHEHLSIFSTKSIKYLCESNNLKLFNVERVTTKGGSLRYYICSQHNKININKNVKKMLSLEIKDKCFNKKTFEELKKKINLNRLKLNKIIDKNSNNIIGLGASISCITLMYQLNIADKVNYLLDDNKLKHGMYSPGSNIKIYDPKKFKYNKNQTLLILAWRFKKFFLKKYSSKFKGEIYNIWPNLEKIKND